MVPEVPTFRVQPDGWNQEQFRAPSGAAQVGRKDCEKALG